MEVSTFGGSGFIGYYLHKALWRKGYGIRAYSRSQREGYLHWNYDALPTRHELAIFLSSEANRAGTKPSDLPSLENKLAGLATLARASKYFVFLSSCAVYGYDSHEPHHTTEKLAPSDPYSIDKLACEAVVLENGGLVLRLSNVFGHYSRYRSTITEDLRAQCLAENVTELSLRSYDAVLNFIDVESVVKLILKSLLIRSRGIFNVASGQSLALLDLLHLASATSGKPMAGDVPILASPRLVQLLDISNSVIEFDWRPSSPTDMLRTYLSLPI
jgi:nucleoside-diphosphate-sugar epimerase